MKRLFENCTLRFEKLSPRQNQLIIIDGSNPPELKEEQRDEIRRAADQGSTIFFWNADENSKELIASLTGSTVESYQRDTSSYIIRGNHPIVRKESNKSLYFSELSDAPLSTRTLGGEWAESANLILEACNTDWKKWNYQGEEVKTAKVYRSEREAKHPGKVILQQNYGKGEIIVSTLDLFALSSLAGARVAAMMKNLGAPLKGRVRKIPKALNNRSVLEKALTTDSNGEDLIVKSALSDGFIPAGPGTRSFSFWIFSLRSLEDLLIEPGIPRMDMTIRCDTSVNWSINGREMDSAGVKTYTCEGIPLVKGWNQIVLTASSPFKLSFNCTMRRFLKKLESYVYN